MKNCATVIVSMLILFVCSFEKKKTSAQLEFFPIEWAKDKYNNFDDGKLCMDESVLVNNPPQNERKLIEVMLKYREEKACRLIHCVLHI